MTLERQALPDRPSLSLPWSLINTWTILLFRPTMMYLDTREAVRRQSLTGR